MKKVGPESSCANYQPLNETDVFVDDASKTRENRGGIFVAAAAGGQISIILLPWKGQCQMNFIMFYLPQGQDERGPPLMYLSVLI